MAASRPFAVTTLNVGSPSNSRSLSAGIQSAANTNSSVSTPSSNSPTGILTNSTNTPTPAGSGPSSPLITPPAASQKGSTWHKVEHIFSSNRLNVFFAAIALALGGYYFFGQYILAKKAYEIGLWKDCHDRDDIANTSVCHHLSKISYDNIAKRWSQLASSGTGARRSINDCLTVHVFLAVLCIFGWLLLIGALVFHGLAALCDCCFDRAAGISGSGICHFVFWGLLIAILTMSQGGFYTFSIALGMVVFLNEHLVRSHPINKANAAARCEYDDHCRRGHGYLDEETYYRAWVNMRNEGYRQGVPSPLTASLDGLICNPLFLFGLDFALIMFPTAIVLRTTIRSGFPRPVRDILDSSWHIASPTMLVFFTALCLCGGSFLRPTHRTTIDREAQADRIETISHKSVFLSRMLSILDNITTSRRKDRILDPKKLL